MSSPVVDYASPAVPPGPHVPSLGGRIPSLDGLRALSILLVIIGHVRTTVPHFPFSVRRWATAIPGNASLGVSIFFVISGFLITHLLLREQQKTGRISLPGFYVRRFFRIMPAYYTFLICLIVLPRLPHVHYFHWLKLDNYSLGAAALFITNYSPHSFGEWVGHTWSLSVEEQFYLFWPLLLSLVGRKQGGRIAVALIVAAPLVRIASWFWVPHESIFWHRIPILLHTRVDSLMFGCATAIFYASESFQAMIRRAFALRVHWAAFAFMFLVSPYLEVWSEPSIKVAAPPAPYLTLAGYSLEGVCIVLLLVWAVQNIEHPVGRLLNWKPVVHVGLISYSLYLWQQLFIVGGNPTWTGKFPLNVLCAVAAAEFSYFVIERTFLRLRDRLVGGHRYEKPLSMPLASHVTTDSTGMSATPATAQSG
jgi:peptidoglycan/LPS O-acetylase OafA/YrhL